MHLRSTILLLALAGCGASSERATSPEPPPPVAPTPTPVPSVPLSSSAEPPRAEPSQTEPPEPTTCPEGMAYVDTTYCPKPELVCLESEYNAPNHITICKRFAPGQRCAVPLRRQRYCMDRYEYPNQKGGHPPVMVDAYDAAAMCQEQGKRLCWQSEWESACEGPDKLPFPYGIERDPKACNIDNPWLKPNLDKIYSKDPAIHGPELLKLDQSVRSGARERCVSGFGVHDLTGNFDEWVYSEENRGKSRWAGLKGGAWGHVRNACRPMTTSHTPDFTYYFISFRCCADAAPASTEPSPAGAPPLWTPPPTPSERDPKGKPGRGWTPAPG